MIQDDEVVAILGKYFFSGPFRGQFHQRSTCSFYVRKLCAAFLCLHFRFVLYWRKTVGAKAVRRTLLKLSPGGIRPVVLNLFDLTDTNLEKSLKAHI